MAAQKLKKCILSLCSVVALVFCALLVYGTAVHAVGANDPIQDPADFCTVVLKGTWNDGGSPTGSFKGECYTGVNCHFSFSGIPDANQLANCDSSTYDELKGKNPTAVIKLLSASRGLPAGAQDRLTGYSPTTSATTGSTELNDWLERIVNFLSAVVGIVITGSIIIAGYMYMTARDNASQVEAAKLRILKAVAAMFLFAFAYLLLQWLIPGGVFK